MIFSGESCCFESNSFSQVNRECSKPWFRRAYLLKEKAKHSQKCAETDHVVSSLDLTLPVTSMKSNVSFLIKFSCLSCCTDQCVKQEEEPLICRLFQLTIYANVLAVPTSSILDKECYAESASTLPHLSY